MKTVVELDDLIKDKVSLHENQFAIELKINNRLLTFNVSKISLSAQGMGLCAERDKSAAYVVFNAKVNKFYIGSSSDVQSRLRVHRWGLLRNKHSNSEFQRDFIKTSIVFMDVLIIYTKDREEAYDVEQLLIDKYRDKEVIYNISPDARKPLMEARWSEERKVAFGAFQKQRAVDVKSEGTRVSPLKGRKLSAEHIAKISFSKLGISTMTEEEKLKRSLNRKGVALKGAWLSRVVDAIKKRQKPVMVDGTAYANVTEVSAARRITPNNVVQRIINKSDRFKGWFYIEPNDG